MAEVKERERFEKGMRKLFPSVANIMIADDRAHYYFDLQDLEKLWQAAVASHAPATAPENWENGLREALKWMLVNFELAIAGKPVRNADEIISFAKSALAYSPAPSTPETGKRMMVSYPGLPSDEPHEESPDCRGQGCIPLERLKPTATQSGASAPLRARVALKTDEVK